jgi:hypothetical protein
VFCHKDLSDFDADNIFFWIESVAIFFAKYVEVNIWKSSVCQSCILLSKYFNRLLRAAMATTISDILKFFKRQEVFKSYFFVQNSLVARNFTFKVDKWDDQSLNSAPCIYIMHVSTNCTKLTWRFFKSFIMI